MPATDAQWVMAASVAGLLIGSFLNVVIHRLHGFSAEVCGIPLPLPL